MKIKIEGKGEDSMMFLIGKSGQRYRVTCEGESKAFHTRLLFEQDLRDFIMDSIEESLTNEEIETHGKYLFAICGIGFMDWARGLQELLIKVHKKACEWTLNKIKTRVRKLINSTLL